MITWRTWFLAPFPAFAERKCNNSLQSVCFDLSKRKRRRVSTRHKRHCEMSPAAQCDELQFCVNLQTCSNGLFTLPFRHKPWRSVCSNTHMDSQTRQERSAVRYTNQHVQGFFFSYFVCRQLKMHLPNNTSQWKMKCESAHAFLMTVGIRLFLLSSPCSRSDFLSVHLKVEFWPSEH